MNDGQRVYEEWAADQVAKHGERDQPLRVIRLLGLVNGQPTSLDGQYVVSYDPSRGATPLCAGLVMNAQLLTTDDVAAATRYTTAGAMQLMLEVDQRNPVRRDGKPNRPLTAFMLLLDRTADEAARWPE